MKQVILTCENAIQEKIPEKELLIIIRRRVILMFTHGFGGWAIASGHHSIPGRINLSDPAGDSYQ
jgi:hypothetical protein